MQMDQWREMWVGVVEVCMCVCERENVGGLFHVPTHLCIYTDTDILIQRPACTQILTQKNTHTLARTHTNTHGRTR